MSIEKRAMRRKETESSRSWSELSSTHRCRMRGIPGKKEDEWFPDREIARSLPRKPVRILMYQTSCYLRLVRSILSFIPSSIRPDRLSSPFWVNALFFEFHLLYIVIWEWIWVQPQDFFEWKISFANSLLLTSGSKNLRVIWRSSSIKESSGRGSIIISICKSS